MIPAKHGNEQFFDAAVRVPQRSLLRFATVVAMALAFTIPASAQIVQTPAQIVQTPALQVGKILGTVTDVKGDPVVGATVVLTGPDSTDRRTVVTPENGFFQFDDLKAASYQIVINADGFAEWTSPPIALEPGQVNLVGSITLRLATQNTTVHVTYDPVEIATEQVKLEETQRVLGIIPNFYVSYQGGNTAPLTTRIKFALALKVSYDPVTIGGVALVAAFRQAANSPDYPQGAVGYGERFGATAADGLTDIMIGGAILPSLLHQDPRYFYQGTGTTGSRIRHAMRSPFVAKGDNGKWQPNYSSLGGDLGSAALSNLYFPKSNRGAGLVFSQFALGTAERVGASLAQEFILSRLTHKGR
jgi:Carboxypeptidase regulatory-like domain